MLNLINATRSITLINLTNTTNTTNANESFFIYGYVSVTMGLIGIFIVFMCLFWLCFTHCKERFCNPTRSNSNYLDAFGRGGGLSRLSNTSSSQSMTNPDSDQVVETFVFGDEISDEINVNDTNEMTEITKMQSKQTSLFETDEMEERLEIEKNNGPVLIEDKIAGFD
jgi:hypothetical protein